MKRIYILLVFIISVFFVYSAYTENIDEMDNTQLRSYLERLELIKSIRQLENELNETTVDAIKIKYQEKVSDLEIEYNSRIQAAQEQISDLQLVIDKQNTLIGKYESIFFEIENIHSRIIYDLTQAFENNQLAISIDQASGKIILEGKLFFDSSRDTIRAEGQDLLSRFVPVYLGVLMRPEYVDYVGEIIIEGHTDDQGSYMSNLKLSQNRALSVAEYCLQLSSLTNRQVSQLQSLLTAKGRSYSDLIYNADGTVNREASRRVEFKFRLKDSEMIQEMNRILTQMEAQNSL